MPMFDTISECIYDAANFHTAFGGPSWNYAISVNLDKDHEVESFCLGHLISIGEYEDVEYVAKVVGLKDMTGNKVEVDVEIEPA